MLILARSVGQQIRIGNNITIQVLETDNSMVKIGIEGPRHIAVHRGEVYHRIALEKAKLATKESDQKPSQDK